MGGRGDDVGVLEGVGSDARSDKARDVGHVGEEVGADVVADGAHAGVVVVARVGAEPGDDELGKEHAGRLVELVIVDQACLLVQPATGGPAGVERVGQGRDGHHAAAERTGDASERHKAGGVVRGSRQERGTGDATERVVRGR